MLATTLDGKAPWPAVSVQEMCEWISVYIACVLHQDLSPEHIFNLHPRGELYFIWDWYAVALDWGLSQT